MERKVRGERMGNKKKGESGIVSIGDNLKWGRCDSARKNRKYNREYSRCNPTFTERNIASYHKYKYKESSKTYRSYGLENIISYLRSGIESSCN